MTVFHLTFDNLHAAGYSSIKEWMSVPGNVYVGGAGSVVEDGERFRWTASKFCNPYSGRDNGMDLFQDYFFDSCMVEKVESLVGCVLGCLCDGSACHAEFLSDYIDDNF